jgi:hypothetical protein
MWGARGSPNLRSSACWCHTQAEMEERCARPQLRVSHCLPVKIVPISCFISGVESDRHDTEFLAFSLMRVGEFDERRDTLFHTWNAPIRPEIHQCPMSLELLHLERFVFHVVHRTHWRCSMAVMELHHRSVFWMLMGLSSGCACYQNKQSYKNKLSHCATSRAQILIEGRASIRRKATAGEKSP